MASPTRRPPDSAARRDHLLPASSTPGLLLLHPAHPPCQFLLSTMSKLLLVVHRPRLELPPPFARPFSPKLRPSAHEPRPPQIVRSATRVLAPAAAEDPSDGDVPAPDRIGVERGAAAVEGRFELWKPIWLPQPPSSSSATATLLPLPRYHTPATLVPHSSKYSTLPTALRSSLQPILISLFPSRLQPGDRPYHRHSPK